MTDKLELSELDRAEAFRYMGYKGGEIKESILKITEECEMSVLDAVKPRLVYKVFDVGFSEKGVEIMGTSLIFRGSDIREHLSECSRCVLMCVTLSADVDKLIRSYEAEGMEKALIADALASAAVEQVCNKAEALIQSALGNYSYTWRFSPGYGDFPLDIQKEFISVTEADRKIGLTVTENLILIPRKSVTAVMGISEKEIPKKRRGCGCCNMKDKCEFRKGGSHCGF